MNLFVYGTLLVPKIWDIVSEYPNPESAAASLHGFSIYRVKDGDFPGIVEDPKAPAPVPGRVILNIPKAAMQRLDDYEGSFYIRQSLVVSTPTEEVEAFAYVIPRELSYILTKERWTLNWFEKWGLERYWQGHWG